MAKIIKVDSGIVIIVRNDGELIEVQKYTLGFEPKVNDIVEVYDNKGEYIINKVETSTTKTYTGKRPVNKIGYCLLAIFLGGLGIHKFYAGKVGMGIIYILFSWTLIPSVIGFIEGILAAIKDEVEPGIILV